MRQPKRLSKKFLKEERLIWKWIEHRMILLIMQDKLIRLIREMRERRAR